MDTIKNNHTIAQEQEETMAAFPPYYMSASIAFFALNILFLVIYIPACIWLKVQLKSKIDRFQYLTLILLLL